MRRKDGLVGILSTFPHKLFYIWNNFFSITTSVWRSHETVEYKGHKYLKITSLVKLLSSMQPSICHLYVDLLYKNKSIHQGKSVGFIYTVFRQVCCCLVVKYWQSFVNLQMSVGNIMLKGSQGRKIVSGGDEPVTDSSEDERKIATCGWLSWILINR